MDGHDNDADKNAQGIFSTPELTVDAGKITQQNNADTKSRVASIFANTDAGKQAQQLNNAMDAQTTPAEEDVVVQNGPKKKSKLPLVILILVLVAAGVGGLVWFLVNNITPQAAAPSINEAKVKFDNYATYLLYEKSENELTGEYSAMRTYSLDNAVFNATDFSNDAYWANSRKLLTEATELYSNTEDPDKYLISFLKAQQENISFLELYSKVQTLSDQNILSVYSASGDESAKDYVNNSLVGFADLNFSVADEYSKTREKQYLSIIELFSLYSENNCLSDHGIDETCTYGLGQTQGDKLSTITRSISESKQKADMVVVRLTQQTIQSCWQINARFDQSLEDDSSNNGEESDE